MRFFYFVIFLLLFQGLFAQDVYVQCGQIFDSATGQLLSEKTIVVSGTEIKSVLDGYRTGGAEDQIIDLQNKYVLPGLIDMHVHIEGEYQLNPAIRTYCRV